MLSKKFQQRVYNAYKQDPDAEVKHGNFTYAIAYNSCANIHTWIIRKGINDNTFHWLQPLDVNIK